MSCNKRATEDKLVQDKDNKKESEETWLTWKAKITIRTISKDGIVVSWIPCLIPALWNPGNQWSFKASPEKRSVRHGLRLKTFYQPVTQLIAKKDRSSFENSNMAHLSIAFQDQIYICGCLDFFNVEWQEIISVELKLIWVRCTTFITFSLETAVDFISTECWFKHSDGSNGGSVIDKFENQSRVSALNTIRS